AVQLQLLADQLVLAPGLAAADQGRHAAPEHLVLAIAGDIAEGLVHRQQQVVGIEDDDTLAAGLEHRRGQALLLVQALAFGDVATRAEHAQHAPLGVALDRPATVLDPAPAAVGVAHAVLHAVAVAAPLEVLDQGPAQHGVIVRIMRRLDVAVRILHIALPY